MGDRGGGTQREKTNKEGVNNWEKEVGSVNWGDLGVRRGEKEKGSVIVREK